MYAYFSLHLENHMLYKDHNYSPRVAQIGHAFREGSTAVKSSKAQGPNNRAFLRPFGVEHHPHTRLSLGHGSNTTCKDLEYFTKRLGF